MQREVTDVLARGLTDLEKYSKGVARRFGLSAADAEDIRQVAFLQLLPHTQDPAFREVLPRARYLKATVLNLARNMRRSQARRGDTPLLFDAIANPDSQFADLDAETVIGLVRERLRPGGVGGYALAVICGAEPFPKAPSARRRLSRGVAQLMPVAEGVVAEQFGFRRLQEFLDAVARVRVMAVKTVLPVPEPQTPRDDILVRVVRFAGRHGAEATAAARRALSYRAQWALGEFERGKSEEKLTDDLGWQARRPGKVYPCGDFSDSELSAARSELWSLITELREAFPTDADELRNGGVAPVDDGEASRQVGLSGHPGQDAIHALRRSYPRARKPTGRV